MYDYTSIEALGYIISGSCLMLRISAKPNVSIPIRPQNIDIMITILLADVSCGVIPVESPVVANADTCSNTRFIISTPGCVNVRMMVPATTKHNENKSMVIERNITLCGIS